MSDGSPAARQAPWTEVDPRSGARRGLVRPGPTWLAVLPPIGLILVLVRYGVDVPLSDQWELVPLLRRAAEGQLGAADLWAQHNEHRLVLPRLLLLALARLTGWDVRAEPLASVAVTLVTLGLMLALLRRTARPLLGPAAAWLGVAASAFIFSPAAWQNWVWGWQVQVFLEILAATGVVLALAGHEGRMGRLALAEGAALGGALSFGVGLVLLFLVPLGWALDPSPVASRRRLGGALAALVLAIGVSLAYFAGFTVPAKHAGGTAGLRAPLLLARYVLAFLGAPVAFWSPALAMLAGGLGLALLAGGLAVAWRRGPPTRQAVYPWGLLAASAILAAGLTGLARAGFGVEQAHSSRYMTFSATFWLAVLVTGAVALGAGPPAGVPPAPRRAPVALAGVVLVLVVAGWTLTSWAGLRVIQRLAPTLRQARACLRASPTPPEACLAAVHPDDPAAARDRLPWLRDARLSLFRVPPDG